MRRKQDCGAEGEEAARLNAPATRDDAQQTLEGIERTLAKLPPRVHAALLLHRALIATRTAAEGQVRLLPQRRRFTTILSMLRI